MNSRSAVFAVAGITVSTSRSTAEVRTIGPTPGMRDPLIATPSIQVTTSTATTLRAAPPTASTALAGCHVIVSRARPPTYCRIAWPNDAQISTTNTASSDTSSDGSRLPSRIGASQMPSRPPRIRPTVENAPLMKPCQ